MFMKQFSPYNLRLFESEENTMTFIRVNSENPANENNEEKIQKIKNNLEINFYTIILSMMSQTY